MSVRHVLAAVAVATLAGIALPASPSYAVGPTDVYVTTGGTDNVDCSQAIPCATVAAAIFAADATGTTIHVGPGTFDGELRPWALSKSVSVVGSGTGVGDTTLTADSSGDGFVLEVGGGTTALSDLTVKGGLFVDVLVDGTGTVTADHVVLGQSGCNLLVQDGSATLTDSTVRDGGQGCPTPDIPPAEVSVTGGDVSLVRTQVLDAHVGDPGVAVSGGTFSADQSLFDDSGQSPDLNDSHGVKVTGTGAATLSRSTFHGWPGVGVDVEGGTADVRDSSFQDNVVGVNGGLAATVTVVRSTFEHEVASLQGDVSVAGSVLGSMLGTPAIGIKECNGTVTDLGYNLSTDDSCAFTQPTSKQNVGNLNLGSGLADWGGPVPTVATFWPSSAVDSIPAGATYGVSATPLCAGTDLRGVPRPQAGACDAGSMELVATATGLKAPTTARPHASVTLDATVAVPDVGVSGIGAAVGTVTFRSGTTVLCQDVALSAGAARCVTTALGAGSRPVRATFTPVVGSTLHTSVSATRTIKVGTIPAFTSRSRASFVVGTSQTFRVRASGSPGSRITLVKGRLPAGLSFKAGTGTATISGKAKASAVGTHSVTVQATNLRGTVRQVLRIVVTRR